jgi:hypothetical protein
MPAVHVRDATASDAEAIAGLVNRAFLVERFFVDGDRTTPASCRRSIAASDTSRSGPSPSRTTSAPSGPPGSSS